MFTDGDFGKIGKPEKIGAKPLNLVSPRHR